MKANLSFFIFFIVESRDCRFSNFSWFEVKQHQLRTCLCFRTHPSKNELLQDFRDFDSSLGCAWHPQFFPLCFHRRKSINAWWLFFCFMFFSNRYSKINKCDPLAPSFFLIRSVTSVTVLLPQYTQPSFCAYGSSIVLSHRIMMFFDLGTSGLMVSQISWSRATNDFPSSYFNLYSHPPSLFFFIRICRSINLVPANLFITFVFSFFVFVFIELIIFIATSHEISDVTWTNVTLAVWPF